MRWVVALTVAATLVPTACGAGAGGRVAFSQVEVQAYLEREVARTLPELTVGAATCPARLPVSPGDAVGCTVVVAGTPLDYEVERLVADRFEVRPRRPIVVVADVATAVREKLGTEVTQVRCGDAPVVQPASGRPLACQVDGPGSSRAIVVRVGPGGALVVTDS